jgi:predicted aconitase
VIKLMTARIMRHRQGTFWSTKKTGMAKNAKIERSVLQTLLAHFSCSRNKLTGTKLSPPDWLVEVKTSRVPNAQVLGSAIGMKVVEDVPYITGLDQFLGGEITTATRDYLKDMGAASASNGAVGLYHVENLTPEAVEQGRDLLTENYQTYTIDDAEIERVIRSYPVMWRKAEAKPRLCFIGCPHLSLQQLESWSDAIVGALSKRGRTKVAIPTILCAAPDVIEAFAKDRARYEQLQATGARLTSICALMYMNNPLCAKKPVITNSNKLRTYTTAKFMLDDEILEQIVNG